MRGGQRKSTRHALSAIPRGDRRSHRPPPTSSPSRSLHRTGFVASMRRRMVSRMRVLPHLSEIVSLLLWPRFGWCISARCTRRFSSFCASVGGNAAGKRSRHPLERDARGSHRFRPFHRFLPFPPSPCQTAPPRTTRRRKKRGRCGCLQHPVRGERVRNNDGHLQRGERHDASE